MAEVAVGAEPKDASGRRRRRPAGFTTDLLLAGIITIFAQANLAFGLDNSTRFGPPWLVVTYTLLATGALAFRRLRPTATAVTVAAILAVPQLVAVVMFTIWGGLLPLATVTYAIGRYSSGERRFVGVAAVATAVGVVIVRNPEVQGVGALLFAGVPLVGVLAAGVVLQRLEQARKDDRERVHRLQAEREEAIEAALAEERATMARELHDIVAHWVSVMVVQAGAAEDLLGRDPAAARTPLTAVQDSGRQAVKDLRRMLSVLRGERRAPALAPLPGVDDLSALAGQMRAVGLPVEVTTTGEVRPLLPGVGLTLYRVAQEALTNALKHAGPATAYVSLCYEPDAVALTVRDDGGRGAETPGASNRVGHGLLGMRERVGLYGGTLETGPAPGGGFQVTARLPLPVEDRP